MTTASCTRCESSDMRHWRSASLSWCLRIAPLISSGERCSQLAGELGVLAQLRAAVAAKLRTRLARRLLAQLPLRVGPQRAAQLPGVHRVERVGLLDARSPQRPCRSARSTCVPCCLTSDLKKAMPSISPFAFVDAGGEVLVDVVAEQVAVQERPAAVRLHEQLDGGFLLRLAAEDLGDDALHLAAIALVDRAAAAPGDQRVAADDQPGQPAEPPPHQLARGDRLRRRSRGTAPRGSCWPSSAASCRRRSRTAPRGRGSGRDRRSSGRRRACGRSRFSAGTRKSLKTMPLVVGVLERVQAVLLELEAARSPAAADRRSAPPACRRSGRPGRSCGRARRW